jgi:pimeloyl-ACP methyl ester carboxylesterase
MAYSAVGSGRGYPVVYLHGAIGSPRWRTPALDAAIEALGLRYVLPERPGFGGSDPDPGRTVAGYADDIEQLADALGWRRFAVVGVSAGAPYALACGWAMPERVGAVAAVSTLPPPRAGRSGRFRLRYRVPQIVFGTPALGRVLASASLAAMRLRRLTPPRAMVEDYDVCCRPWGFEPEEIPGPVTLWHARRDRLVPASHALRLASALPAGAPAVEPRGGHFFFRSRVREILAGLVEPEAAERPVSIAA